MAGKAVALAMLLMAAGCAKESRTLDADQPQTSPQGAADPRAAKYEGNAYQVAQGGRYFTWYGCGRCHGAQATGTLDLADTRWVHGGDLDQVYAFIATGHPGELARYDERIAPEQLWQLTAYVRSLPALPPERRYRQDVDQAGEPQGATWSGPVE